MKIKHIFKILAAGMILGGCQPQEMMVKDVKMVELTKTAGQAEIPMTVELNAEETECVAKTPENVFKMHHAARDFQFNNIKMWFAYPALFKEHRVWIAQDDFQRTLLPLLDKALPPAVSGKTIVIDPGHGGKDVGAVGKISQEKNLNWAISRLVGDILTARGFTVIYTRSGDETVELAPRAAKAAGTGADLFVAIHCNAAPNPQANGIETFSISPRGAANSNDNADHSLAVNANAEAKGYAHTVESFMLSAAIQQELIRATKATDRGAKRARFHVLYNNTVPAALVECGFMSYPAEEKKLNTTEYQQILAMAIANGITKYAEQNTTK